MSDRQHSPDHQEQALQPTERNRWLEDAVRFADTQKKRAGQILLHSPFHPLYLWIFGRRKAQSGRLKYAQWVSSEESRWPSLKDHQAVAAGWRFRPTISILIPTFQPRKEWLDCAIASVKTQSYEEWQICICDDASSEPWVREYLEVEAATDSRIRVVLRDSNGGISAALNEAGKTGDRGICNFPRSRRRTSSLRSSLRCRSMPGGGRRCALFG